MKLQTWIVFIAVAVLVEFQSRKALAAEAWPAERLGTLFDGAPVRAPLETEVSAPKDNQDPRSKPAEISEAKTNDELLTPQKPMVPSPAKPAAPPIKDIAGSDWRMVGRVEDSFSESNPASREKIDFWDKLRNESLWSDAADELCKQAKIPLRQSFEVGGIFRTEPEFERSLRKGIDGRMILVDRTRVSFGLGYSWSVLDLGSEGSVSLGVGADIDGQSLVSRPLKSERACSELDELVDLRTIKVVLPLRAERFSAMDEGEIWVIPLRFRTFLGAGMGFNHAGIPLSVSFGYSREGGTSVSLRRLDKDTLRARIRIDYASVHGPGGGVLYTVLGTHFADFRNDGKQWSGEQFGEFLGEKGAWRLVDRVLRRQFDRYLTTRLTWMAQWGREDHAIIEFRLNPNDEAHMKALEKLLAGGDLAVADTLLKMGKASALANLGAAGPKRQLELIKESAAEAFGETVGAVRSFTGTEKATSILSGLHAKFPVLFDLNFGWGKKDEHITLHDQVEGRHDIYRAHDESSKGFVDLPWLGKVFNYNQKRSVMVFTREGDGGQSGSPALVYHHQEGYTRQNEVAARSMARHIDGIMRLAGTRGQGENLRAGLPLEQVFPRISPAESRSGNASQPSYAYRRGVGAFTLVLGEAAITDIINAKPADVVRSFVSAYKSEPYLPGLQSALVRGKISPEGKVDYDRPWSQGTSVAFGYAHDLAQELKKISRMQTQDAPGDPQALRRQAEAIRDLVAGSVGYYGLSYDQMMKVMIQLTDPAHVSAEFTVMASPKDKKLHKTVEGRYLLNRGLDEDQGLRRVAEAASRFNPPSEIAD